MKRILKPISYVLAAIYLCVDFIFAGIARPISNWIARHVKMRALRRWIKSLSPYPSLALFSVPVVLLEPVKFVAAYVAATGNFIVAFFTFAFGELLKLVLIERLFELTRDKLMKIPAFARVYGYYMRARNWIMQSEAWQALRLAARKVLSFVRGALNLEGRARGSSRRRYACGSITGRTRHAARRSRYPRQPDCTGCRVKTPRLLMHCASRLALSRHIPSLTRQRRLWAGDAHTQGSPLRPRSRYAFDRGGAQSGKS